MATVVAHYKDRVGFDDAKFSSKVVVRHERVQVMVVSFRPGQFIPVHKPDVDLTFTVLQGKALLIAGDEELEIEEGAIVFIPAGEARGVKAITEFVFTSAVTPPPTDEDHTDVHKKLQEGALR